ncbi:MAG: SidA/IucD/PvdA family monooxygenase [Planctomycetota bacterium]
MKRCWKSARATSIKPMQGGYRVQTEAGERLEAKRVVLALGMGDQLHWPVWARPLRSQNRRARVHHVFAPDFKRQDVAEDHSVVVVGGGISAAQLALSLFEANPDRRITIVSRHLLKKEDFDSDPGWLGPTLLKNFHSEKSYARRRAMIQEARNLGSLASEVLHSLENAIRTGTIRWKLAEIAAAAYQAMRQKVRISLCHYELDETLYRKTREIVSKLNQTPRGLEADVVLLATGFEAKRPGGSLVDDAVQSMNLPTARDGFPILDRHLSWREGLYVMGPLAELEVGPASRNLSGARMAAGRIVKCPRVEWRVAVGSVH